MKCRVWLRSVPGPYEQYDGYVDVHVEDVNDAFDRAVQELRRGNFPARDRGMWKLERIEIR